MKKNLFFLLLMLMSIGAEAATHISLNLGAKAEINTEWSYQVVLNAKDQLQVADKLIISFDPATATDQYAICNVNGDKIFTDNADPVYKCYTCNAGQTDFTIDVTQDLLNAIQTGGLRIEYKGLKNLKAEIKRYDLDITDYIPKNHDGTAVQSLGSKEIADWYEKPLTLKTTSSNLGKTLRVVCCETGHDAYAFLKKNDNDWNSIMSGSDKFSIAGWKYFEIKINSTLDGILQGDGLLIGGNNYYIAGTYIYDSGDNTTSDWNEEDTDVIDIYTFGNGTFQNVGTDGWKEATIAGSFFEYKGQTSGQAEKIANTKNNIIRIIFSGTAGDNAEVSAKDAANTNAAYIRARRYNSDGGNFYYTNYANCAGKNYYDFELSDAITIFENYKKPKTGAEGVQKGMLSYLLKNGMLIGAHNVEVTKVQIRKSLVSKYVKGYAILKDHKLSSSLWRTITFPYNLTREQLTKAFGSDVRICELGKSEVIKTKITEEVNKGSYHYSINFNFTKIGDKDGINANYPYLIRLGNGVNTNDSYPIKDVKADVRDFQSYEFRTAKFNLDALDEAKKTEGNQDIINFEAQIVSKLNNDNVCMKFVSTAPVFDIINKSDGEVENIRGVLNDGRTILKIKANNGGNTNYYLSKNWLYPVTENAVALKSGLAYIVLPAETDLLFKHNEQQGSTSSASKAITFSIDGEGDSTTAIDDLEVVTPVARQTQSNIYSLNGQLIRKGLSTQGLPKGIYIVGGKKLIIK